MVNDKLTEFRYWMNCEDWKKIIKIIFAMRILLLLGIFVFFTACDYSNDYVFEITNNIEDTITINVTNSKEGASNQYLGEKYTIYPNETKRVFIIWGGVSGHNYYPVDECEADEILPPCDKFDIRISDSLISREKMLEIRKRKYWSYKAEEHLGIYNLNIKKELLE